MRHTFSAGLGNVTVGRRVRVRRDDLHVHNHGPPEQRDNVLNRRISTVVAGVIVLALAITGCATQSHVQPWDPPSPSSTPTTAVMSTALSWDDGTELVADRLALADAVPAIAGTDFDVLYTTPEELDGSSMGVLALAPDGRALVALGPADNYGLDGWLRQQGPVGYFDGERFAPFETSPNPVQGDHPRQTYAGAIDGDVAVWAETDSTDLYHSNWRLFSRAGVVSRTVGYAEQIQEQGLPIVDGDTTPVLSGGRVYFATAAPTGDPDVPLGEFGSYQMTVMSAEPDGTGTRVEVPFAAQPAAAGGNLYVVRTSMDDPSLTDGQVSIELADGTGSASPLLTRNGVVDSQIASLVTNGHHIAFVDRPAGGRASVVVVDTRDRTAVRIPLGDGPSNASLAICGNLLTWNNAPGDASGLHVPQYVLNVDTDALWTIEVEEHYPGTRCAGDLLAWSQLSAAPGSSSTTTVVRWHAEN